MDTNKLPVDMEEALVKNGFIGIDASISESLLHYGMIWSPVHGTVIRCIPDYDSDIDVIGNTYYIIENVITKKWIKEFISDMEDSFFSYIGKTRKRVLKSLDLNDYHYINTLDDINGYDGSFNEYLDSYRDEEEYNFLDFSSYIHNLELDK